jgi:hypothetical protein
MEYNIIYDANSTSFPNTFFLPGIIIITVTLVFSVMYYNKNRNIHIIIVAFICSITIGAANFAAYSYIYPMYMDCQRAFRTGDYTTVTGIIENFQPRLNGKGSPPEQFTVKGVKFSYTDGIIGCGFSQTRGTGGSIQNGMNVRITYLPYTQNKIIRFEIHK